MSKNIKKRTFIIAIILLTNFIGVSIRNQMKQIGILTALGADNKSLIKVYGSNVALICTAVYILALILSIVFTVIINNLIVTGKNILFKVLWFNPALIAILLAIVFGSGFIGFIFPLLRMRKLTPIDAINEGQIK